jgi:hypothetical protein
MALRGVQISADFLKAVAISWGLLLVAGVAPPLPL